MKKLSLSLVTTALLFTTQTADAAKVVPSSMNIGVKSYEAVIQKATRAVNGDTSEVTTLKKGKKVTVVERKVVDGYDFLVLKGNLYIPVDDSNIKIGKALAAKINYSKTKMDPLAKAWLDDLTGYEEYYYPYKKYLYIQGQNRANFTKANMRSLITNRMYGTVPAHSTWGTPYVSSYDMWVDMGMETARKETYYSCNNSTVKIDILSDQFKNIYFDSETRTIKGLKKYQDVSSVAAQPCDYLGTDAGYVWRIGDVGYVKDYPKTGTNNGQIKEVVITPSKKVTYHQIIKKYGKPTSVSVSKKNRVEYKMIYDTSFEDSYKIIVAMDRKNGKVKYLRKIDG
ncbi:hypothetical protein [Macrococcus equi]|uniref:hypothetical protein n=1 Tax=Macrococcus equi TaxID=3395462 RepID=UPI0039BE3F21